MQENQNTKLWHALYETPGVGEGTILKLMRAFPNPENALGSNSDTLTKTGLAAREQSALCNSQNVLRKADESWEDLQKQNISVTSIQEGTYPKLLKEIPDPPPLLYSKGDLSIFDSYPVIAIVGTRKPTDYGRHVTQKLSEEFARAGLVIVSGLALGLDAVAHRGALEARGLTAAVLGNGLNEKCMAPRNHLMLSRSIVNNGGCLISEFPPNTQASAGTFPMRNRIVAGLTLGTIVVEAAEKSGTLITARLALEYNREVFAVPGSILSPLSQGANKLLKKGAHAITSSQDVLDILSLSKEQVSECSPLPDTLSQEEKSILNALSAGPLSIQELVKQTTFTASVLNAHLTMLELNGFIKDVGNGKYIKNF